MRYFGGYSALDEEWLTNCIVEWVGECGFLVFIDQHLFPSLLKIWGFGNKAACKWVMTRSYRALRKNTISLSLYIYIYIYMCVCVCVCVCIYNFILSNFSDFPKYKDKSCLTSKYKNHTDSMTANENILYFNEFSIKKIRDYRFLEDWE